MDEKKITTYEDFLIFRDDMVNYANSLLCSRDEAEDLVQDVYMKLWERKDQLAQIDNPKTYCSRIVRNRSMDILESLENRKRTQMPSEIFDDHSIEEQMAAKQRLAVAMSEIETLPEGQRNVITKHGVEELSYEQISQQTGLDERTLRTQMSLARKTLRRRLSWVFAGVAVLLCVGVGTFYKKPVELTDTFESPELAYVELEKTLDYISVKLNESTAFARSAGADLEKAEELFNMVK